MNITVILCTRNRCQILAGALESIADSVLPESVEWEVLVVDNNSNDQTPEVAREFAARYPGRFRYIFEPRPGKSHAMNTGVRESRGDILAFVDDDVTVESGWLQQLTAHLHNGDWAGAGGRILLAGAFSPPPWLAVNGPHNMGGVLAALFDCGDEASALDEAPYGANMAFRKEMFEKYGVFRIDLGPSPNPEIPRPNEDTEFGRRLLSGGERLRYEPSAIIYHPVHTDRLRKDYFLDWWFDAGRASIREVPRRRDIGGVPREYFTILKIIGTTLTRRALQWMLALNRKERFYFKCRVWATAGQIVELRRQSAGAKTQ